MRILMLAVALAGLSACETNPQPMQRSAQMQATYDRMLAGKVAGPPVRCLPTRSSSDMTVIDDNTILFRVGNTIYVNNPPGGCMNLNQSGRALVTRNVGPQLCRGDIGTVVDNTSGVTVGSCALGDFVPYAPARS